MFEQSFVAGTARVRTGWSMVISMATQACVLGVAIVAPLVNPQLLPLAVGAWDIRIAPPPGRPAAPPPAPETAPKARAKAAPSQVRNAALITPLRIPERPELIIDEAPLQAAGPEGPYVPGMREGAGVPGGMAPSVARLAPPPPPPPAAKATEPEQKQVVRIRMGGDVQQGRLIHQVTPKYPPLAVQTRTQGKVTFTAVISTQGQIMNLQLVSGHPMLTAAAAEAVRQWRYRPTLLNGDAVEVVTVIEVHFTLHR
jgi:protein TonB